MTPPGGRSGADRGQHGYVMIVLLAALGVGLLVAAAFAPADLLEGQRERVQQSERLVGDLSRAALEAYRGTGAFPPNLPALVAFGGVPSMQLAIRDPFGGSAWVDYQVVPGVSATVTSRGPDGQLGSADDIVATAVGMTPARAEGRNRLRLLRAAFATSVYMYDPSMQARHREMQLDALRQWALARRATLYATTNGGQNKLKGKMNGAAGYLNGMQHAYKLPDAPTAATGSGGLMEALGLPDALAQDFHGQDLVTCPVGFTSDGLDAVSDTIDDL